MSQITTQIFTSSYLEMSGKRKCKHLQSTFWKASSSLFIQFDFLEQPAAFLNGGDLPDPRSLSDTASKMLNVNQKDIEWVYCNSGWSFHETDFTIFSPTSILEARKKRICPVCTLESDRPVMIEEGAEWDTHQKTRSHQRLAKKRLRDQDLHITS